MINLFLYAGFGINLYVMYLVKIIIDEDRKKSVMKESFDFNDDDWVVITKKDSLIAQVLAS